MNPYAYFFWLWLVFHPAPRPYYAPPPPPPVYWSYTAPDTRPRPQVVVMPPCRVLSPNLTVCG